MEVVKNTAFSNRMLTRDKNDTFYKLQLSLLVVTTNDCFTYLKRRFYSYFIFFLSWINLAKSKIYGFFWNFISKLQKWKCCMYISFWYKSAKSDSTRFSVLCQMLYNRLKARNSFVYPFEDLPRVKLTRRINYEIFYLSFRHKYRYYLNHLYESEQ